MYRHGTGADQRVQYKQQDTITRPGSIGTHGEDPEFRENYPTSSPAETINNINDPWIDPSTGMYWNMSITKGAFDRLALSIDHEKYYMNMRWTYYTEEQKQWYFGKKVWIKNPANGKAVLAGILDNGPAADLQHPRVAGASPEAMKAIGAETDSNLEYCWATYQDIPYGYKLNF